MLADGRERDMRGGDDPCLPLSIGPRQARRRLARPRAQPQGVAFGLVGVVNTVVDYGVFSVRTSRVRPIGGRVGDVRAVVQRLRLRRSPRSISLIAANTLSWIVAVTGSYIMNSSITFAAESGRELRWRAYFAFVASGVAGWIANTAAAAGRRGSPAAARVAGEGARHPRELHRELLALAFRRLSGAPGRREQSAERCLK